MIDEYQTTAEGVKRLSELLIESTTWFDGEAHLTLEQEEALEWARKFISDYGRKHKRRTV